MPRDERAYLADVIDSCEAITNARRIIDFRNQLTHEYPTVDDALVWAIVEKDVPLLRRECSVLLREAGSQEERE